jgi:glutamate 5-kinase
MATKLEAARIAMTAGCATAITLGTQGDSTGGPLSALTSGARATWFLPDVSPETARRQWLMGALKPSGTVRIDPGAAKALKSGKSLLAAGVTAVSGRFERGDAVDVVDPDGATIARGVSAYSSEDATRLIGKKSDEFEAILGYRGRPALIHVDDLVLTA